MAFYNVTRPMPGGWNGYGAQTIFQTSIQEATVAPTPPTGGTVTPNPDATAATDWAVDSTQTVLPATATDHYGGFPVTGT